jgi:1-acyl-sn-glycerol-3-phosphate acyltransferase
MHDTRTAQAATDAATPPRRPFKGPRRKGVAHWIALARTIVYSALATIYFLLMTTLGAWILLLPAERMRPALILWAAGDLWLLKVVAGQRVRVIGRQNVPDGPALIASKHHAEWETMALLPLLPRTVVILKRELLSIPLYGWYARHFGMIPIDRSAGSSALRKLAVDAGRAVAKGARIVIFPEGTRRPVGAPPDYKPGAIFLYERLKVPMVPVALNSGLFWPRRRFVRYPGTITVSFLPPVPPGLPRAEAKARLEAAVETETERLVREVIETVPYDFPGGAPYGATGGDRSVSSASS